MRARHVAGFVSGIALAIAVAAEPTGMLDPIETTVLQMRLSAVVLGAYEEAGGRFPCPCPSLTSLTSLADTLGPELRRELALRDGWNRPLKVLLASPHDAILISYGADDTPDLRYVDSLLEATLVTPKDLDPSSADRDVVFADGEIVSRPNKKEPSAKRVTGDLRVIATAIESYGVDNDAYPALTGGLQIVDTLAADLEPIYIKRLPRIDPWGHPYLVRSDGKQYVLLSTGADGRLDRDYSNVAQIRAELGDPETTSDPNLDVVFVDGSFLRLPGH